MTTATLAPLGDELLDHPDADPATVRQSLHHIARANWWFGGWWAVRHGLGRLLAGAPAGRTLTLLDVGCGGGDLARRAVGWAARRGVTLTVLGLDRHPAAAQLARGAGVPSLVGCAGGLPIRPRSVDLVVASQLLHHFAPETSIAFCQAAGAVARVGVVIADLRRAPLAVAGFWIGARVLGFDPATRQDGITSVRRGYLPGELAALLARAGVPARVERTPGYRLVATWRSG